MEQIEDERNALPPLGETYTPSAPEPTDEPLEDQDLEALLLKLKGDADDAFDATVRVVSVARDGDHVLVQIERSPLQNDEWSPYRLRVLWQGEERFRHDVLEAIPSGAM